MNYTKSDILTKDGKQYYKAKKFPYIPPSDTDVYVITVEGDRLDLISNDYYKTPEYWKVIAAVNNNITLGSLYPEPGTQLRIPTDLNAVLTIYNNVNK